MSNTAPSQPPTLDQLRGEIDRIDGAMHALLIERGEIIESLIAVKRTQESGAAFRPAREAAMMRKLVERHHGILPLDTVESIWRVIIATFTHVQAPYAVHADLTAGESAMRDCVRFHFGFTVPFITHMGAAGVVGAIASARGDLGLIAANAVPSGSPWWTLLEGDAAPKIIARFPLVERSDHPASLPVFVISRAGPDAMATEVKIFSVHVSDWSAAVSRAIATVADIVAVPDGAQGRAALLVSVPERKKLEEITDMLVTAGATIRSSALVGSHASRYTVSRAALLAKR